MKKRIKRTKKAKQEATQLAEEPIVDDVYDGYYDDVPARSTRFLSYGIRRMEFHSGKSRDPYPCEKSGRKNPGSSDPQR